MNDSTRFSRIVYTAVNVKAVFLTNDDISYVAKCQLKPTVVHTCLGDACQKSVAWMSLDGNAQDDIPLTGSVSVCRKTWPAGDQEEP